jgi:hypothetical protein
MEPANPLENQKPLSPESQEDQMLDTLEHSIENPPGFKDPLAEKHEPFMDDIARQLDKIEDSLEGASPVASENDAITDEDSTNTQAEESTTVEASSQLDNHEDSETVDDSGKESPTSPSALHNPLPDTAAPNLQLPKHPRRGGGSSLRRRGLPFKKRIPGLGRRSRGGRSINLHYCPDSHELIDKKKCKSCEKYRHWPDGTDKGPRECWYDWQTRKTDDETDGSNGES